MNNEYLLLQIFINDILVVDNYFLSLDVLACCMFIKIVSIPS